MRAAIRGDFERLEERRGEQVLLRPREHSEPEAHVVGLAWPEVDERDSGNAVPSDGAADAAEALVDRPVARPL